MKYFEAEKAIEAFAKREMYEAQAESAYASDDLEDWKELATEILQDVPSIEIVRCKDCRYMSEATVNSKGFLICPASGMDITDDDFCSYGVREWE